MLGTRGVRPERACADCGRGGSVAGGATAPTDHRPDGHHRRHRRHGRDRDDRRHADTDRRRPARQRPSRTIPPKPGSPLAPIILPKDQSRELRLHRAGLRRDRRPARSSPTSPQTQIATVAGGAHRRNARPAALPRLLVPGNTAEIVNGLAAAPENAPAAVQQVIWSANQIIGRPYVFGGGHRSFSSAGYDCSGTVSYALHGGHLLQLAARLGPVHGLGQRRPGPLDHDPDQPRARLPRHRRPAPRHERRRRPDEPAGPALAPAAQRRTPATWSATRRRSELFGRCMHPAGIGVPVRGTAAADAACGACAARPRLNRSGACASRQIARRHISSANRSSTPRGRGRRRAARRARRRGRAGRSGRAG